VAILHSLARLTTGSVRGQLDGARSNTHGRVSEQVQANAEAKGWSWRTALSQDHHPHDAIRRAERFRGNASACRRTYKLERPLRLYRASRRQGSPSGGSVAATAAAARRCGGEDDSGEQWPTDRGGCASTAQLDLPQYESEQSHGCVHIRPADRDEMMSRGYLAAGTAVRIMKYGMRGPPR